MKRAALNKRAHETRRLPAARRVAACLLVGALLITPSARAEESPLRNPGEGAGSSESAPPAEAIAHYNRGRELYQAGRYREAVEELEQAQKLDPSSANLVYNLARVYELLGQLDPAIREYRRYHAMLPASETEELARVSGILQRLEGARDEVVSAPAPAPVILTLPEPKRGVADVPFWITTSTAAAALAAGGVVGLLAMQEEREVERFTLGRDGTNADREQLETRANRMALSSDLLMAAGAALGVTAILLYALRERPVRHDPRAHVQLGALPGGALLSVGGRL